MVAAAHAFVGCLAAAAAVAGLDLNAAQGAVIAVAAMILAALYAAADIIVGVLLRHNSTSKFYAVWRYYVVLFAGALFNVKYCKY